MQEGHCQLFAAAAAAAAAVEAAMTAEEMEKKNPSWKIVRGEE